MKVLIANKAGFCMGVRRAVDMTLDLVNRGEENIATFGPLIHNPQVLEVLEDKGVKVLKEVPERRDGTVIIRAHGVPPERKEALLHSGLTVKDATCPRVVKVQAIITRHLSEGRMTVIIGDRNHAEVEGLLGYAGPGALVVSNETEARSIAIGHPYIIVSQTTQDEATFEQLTKILLARFPDGRVFNTICDSTHKRQDEVRRLCREVEALVVVGGKTSANTKRLADIASGMGCPVFAVETEDELDREALRRFATVGVTAGASTPTWMINRVVRALESIPGKGEGRLHPLLYRILWVAMALNLYVSLAGALLVFVSGRLLAMPNSVVQAIMAFGYLFAMHNINRLTDHKAKIFNDPMQVHFFRSHHRTLMAVSVAALIFSLGLAAQQGPAVLALLGIMSLFGLFYSVRVVPESLADVIRVTRLKEIPGSKTFFVALAWALMVVTLPSLGRIDPFSTPHLLVFVLVLGLVFVRNVLYDVFDVQGDRIVGKETLPVFIGEPRTLTVLHAIIGVLLCLAVVLPASGLIGPIGFWLVPGILYLALLARLYHLKRLHQGVKLEFALESSFFILALGVWIGGLV